MQQTRHPCCPSVFMATEGQQAPTTHDDRIVIPTPSGRTRVRPQRGVAIRASRIRRAPLVNDSA